MKKGIFVILLLVLAGSYLLKPTEESKSLELSEEKIPVFPEEIINNATAKLNKLWRSGKYDLSKECPELHWSEKEISREFLKCNVNAWQCHFSQKENQLISFKFNEKSYSLKVVNAFNSIPSFSNEKRFYKGEKNSIKVVLEFSNYRYGVSFKSDCHQSFLPKREYSHSQIDFLDKGSKSVNYDLGVKWKNTKNIFIDKFLVRNKDIAYWKSLKKESFSFEKEKAFLPALNLSLKQMNAYCDFHNKKLLTSRIFDAASFYQDGFKRGHSLPSLFTWGNRNKNSHLNPSFEFLDNLAGDKVKISKKQCKQVYTKECKKIMKPVHYSKVNATWMGIYEISGFYPEALINHDSPYFNIKASSLYFDRFSPWHILSHRFHWDGIGHKVENFKFESSLLGVKGTEVHDDFIGVGFRCYQEL